MNRIVIAYDETESFWEDCADITRIMAVNAEVDYQLKCEAGLTMQTVTDSLCEHEAPNVLAAYSHGDSDGFVNSEGIHYIDKNDDLLYQLSSQMVYAIACYSGEDELVAEMKRKGVIAYWGYKEKFRYNNKEGLAECVTAGLSSMIKGKTLGEAKKDLENSLQTFADNCENPLTAGFILFDKNNLVIEGDDSFMLYSD